MKIHIQRDKFVPLFSLVSNFVSTKDIRPVLQDVKLIVSDSNIILMATDGTVGVRGELAVDESFIIDRVGEALLPAKLLGRIFSETSDSNILLELDGSRLTVKGERFRYQLETKVDVDSFPMVAPFQETTYYKIPIASLNRMISRTTFAIEKSQSAHYELNGVMFFFERERTTAIATDGRRLALQACASEYATSDLESPFEAKKTMFPERTLTLVKRSCSTQEDALIAVSNDSAQIKLGNIVITTNLIAGRFPDWNNILPDKSVKKRVDFIASDLAQAVRQAGIVSTEDKPGIDFNFDPGKVCVTAAGEATGDSSVELPISYDGDHDACRLDAKFLYDFFREVSSDETIAFYFGKDFRTLFETGDGYQYLVMQLSYN